MQEAHQFPSVVAYGRWLVDQPDDAYPLIRMPAQVVTAVRERHKRESDESLRPELYRVQRDVLFLYFLHEHANREFAQASEGLHLRMALLIEKLRTLLEEGGVLSRLHLDRLRLKDPDFRSLERAEARLTEVYLKRARTWPKESDELLLRVRELREAEQMISQRYFAGEDLFYPDVREEIDWSIETITQLKDSYTDAVAGPNIPGPDREAFSLLMPPACRELGEKSTADSGAAAAGFSAGGRQIAQRIITTARAAAFEKLGDDEQANRLEDELLRELVT